MYLKYVSKKIVLVVMITSVNILSRIYKYFLFNYNVQSLNIIFYLIIIKTFNIIINIIKKLILKFINSISLNFQKIFSFL